MYIRSQKKNPKKETQTYMDAAQFEQMPTRTLCGAADELQRFSRGGAKGWLSGAEDLVTQSRG